MTEEQIDNWLRLCERAGRMRPESFTVWAFMVGTSGTLEERIVIGERALNTFAIAYRGRPIHYQVRIAGASDE
jgi:hypothetical protein